MTPLGLHIEALVFASESSLKKSEIKECLEEVFQAEISMKDIEEGLELIRMRYASEHYGFELQEINGGYQFLTKPEHYNIVSILFKQRTRKRLSQAALEALSIIAYKQPVSKSEVEKIRGVNSDHSIQKLLDKELISISGRSEGPGKPLLYSTSDKFLDYLGLKTMEDLPKLKDFADAESVFGNPETGKDTTFPIDQEQ